MTIIFISFYSVHSRCAKMPMIFNTSAKTCVPPFSRPVYDSEIVSWLCIFSFPEALLGSYCWPSAGFLCVACEGVDIKSLGCCRHPAMLPHTVGYVCLLSLKIRKLICIHLSVGGIGCTVTLGMVPHLYSANISRILGILWLVAAALADILITATLVWHLVRTTVR